MAIEVRDPAGREWRVWREWIELLVLLVVVFDTLAIVVPLMAAVAIAGLVKRLLRLAPFSVEARCLDQHVRYPVHGIWTSRPAMGDLATAIATGAGPRLDHDPVARASLH